jgi:hypothetical protein
MKQLARQAGQGSGLTCRVFRSPVDKRVDKIHLEIWIKRGHSLALWLGVRRFYPKKRSTLAN